MVFIGHFLLGEAIQPDPAKVTTLLDMKPTITISEHQGLMVFVNILSHFLPHYSELTELI